MIHHAHTLSFPTAGDNFIGTWSEFLITSDLYLIRVCTIERSTIVLKVDLCLKAETAATNLFDIGIIKDKSC